MNSNFPSFKWRPNRGRPREKKNQLSINDLNQVDKREELLELLEENYDFTRRNQRQNKRNTQ